MKYVGRAMRAAILSEIHGSPPAPTGLGRRLLAEGLGTFCLVFAGTGAVVVNAVAGNPLGHGGVAAAFGLVVAAMIFTVGHLSGAHLNPAITLAFAAGRHFPAREVPWYWAAQAVAAITASISLRGLFGTAGELGATQPAHVGELAALVLEAGLTAVLMMVVLAVATDTRAVGSLAALAIGGTIALQALVFGPITGASMNPARSLGPAVATGDTTGLWIYLCGPTAGALIGLAIYEILRGTRYQPDEPVPEEGTA